MLSTDMEVIAVQNYAIKFIVISEQQTADNMMSVGNAKLFSGNSVYTVTTEQSIRQILF